MEDKRNYTEETVLETLKEIVILFIEFLFIEHKI